MKYLLILLSLFSGTICVSQDIKYQVKVSEIKTDSCYCFSEIKSLTPDGCGSVQISYKTKPAKSLRYFTRCELLTYMPESRPEGWTAYKLSPKEPYPGYWVTGYGWFETIEEANKMSQLIKQQYPEFCKCYGTVVPIWTERFKYEASTIPLIGK